MQDAITITTSVQTEPQTTPCKVQECTPLETRILAMVAFPGEADSLLEGCSAHEVVGPYPEQFGVEGLGGWRIFIVQCI